MCAAYGLPLEEVPVGFKHICGAMVKGGVMLGGEESGGIGFADHIPERDGIAAGLILLEMLAMERKSVNKIVAELNRRFGPHHYDRRDIQFPLERRSALMAYLAANPPTRLLKSPVAKVHAYDGVKFVAADGAWLMLRGSGTEPVLRIYAESASAAGTRTTDDATQPAMKAQSINHIGFRGIVRLRLNKRRFRCRPGSGGGPS